MRGSVCRTARRTPYLPVRDLVRQVCGLVEGDETAGHTVAVQQRLHASGMTAEDDVALLLQLLDLPVAPEAWQRLSPEARQVRTFALLRHLVLDAAQRQPLVLVVENLHWSDPTSEAWLASLVERLAGAGGAAAGDLSAGLSARVGGARRGDAGRLSRRCAPRTVGPWCRRCWAPCPSPRRGCGRWWRRRGAIRSFWRSWPGTRVEQDGRDTPEAVPETVHAVLAARLDRLPPEAKRLLQTAAVIGTRGALAPAAGHGRAARGGAAPRPGAPPGRRVPLRDAAVPRADLYLQARPDARGGLQQSPAGAAAGAARAHCRGPRSARPRTGWPSRSNAWRTMPCGARCGTRP